MERLGLHEVKSYFRLITAFLTISLYQSIKFSFGHYGELLGFSTGGQRALRRIYGLFVSNHHYAGGKSQSLYRLRLPQLSQKMYPFMSFVHVLPDT
jgi:hypothetical protein